MSPDTIELARLIVADLEAGSARWEQRGRDHDADTPEDRDARMRCEARAWALRWAVVGVGLRTDQLAAAKGGVA